MPYNNAYNQNIARQLNNLYKNKVRYENAVADNVRQNDVMDPLEGMALRRDDVHGGGGTAAATLQDLGYEQMKGTTGSGEPPEVKPKRKYVRKTPLPPDAPSVEVVGEGVDRPIGGAHVGCGMSAGAKRAKKKKRIHPQPQTPRLARRLVLASPPAVSLLVGSLRVPNGEERRRRRCPPLRSSRPRRRHPPPPRDREPSPT